MPVSFGMELLVLVTQVLLIMILRLASSASGRLVPVPLLMRKWKVMLLPEELPMLVSMFLRLSPMSRLLGSPARMYMGTLQVNSGSLGMVLRTRWKRCLTLGRLLSVQNG